MTHWTVALLLFHWKSSVMVTAVQLVWSDTASVKLTSLDSQWVLTALSTFIGTIRKLPCTISWPPPFLRVPAIQYPGIIRISLWRLTSLYDSIAVTVLLLGSTVVSPYVGMARKQNGGYNASISVQTPIFHLVVNSTRLKTVRSARWCCPNSTMAPRLLENVVKVTNLEVVKIEFRHLPFLPSFFLSFFSQPSALTRAVPRTKRPWIPVKFLEDVPFELSF